MERTPDYSRIQTKSIYVFFKQIILTFNIKVATVTADM
jgi:hypothetical protein